MEGKTKKKEEPKDFKRFEELTKKIVSVPKTDIQGKKEMDRRGSFPIGERKDGTREH